MVTRYGMLRELGPLAYETEPNGFLAGIPQTQRRLYSEETAREIDVAIRGLVEAAQARARNILEDNRGLLEEGAKKLLAKEARPSPFSSSCGRRYARRRRRSSDPTRGSSWT